MNNFFKLLFLLIIVIISKNIFILFKFNDQKTINNNIEYIKQDINNYNDITRQHGIINNDDVLEHGIFRLHPFSHPNDFDINLAEIKNNMTILDCGCGLIETDIRLLEKYPNLNIHVVTNTNKKNKIIINNKIKNLQYEKKIKPHFIDYKDLLIRFDEIKFDRILFIESLSYSKNIQKILQDCYKILNSDGKVYIRMITAPKTKSHYINKNIIDIEEKIQSNLVYHDNMLYFLQQSGFKNIKFSSIPLILSENYYNPLFYIPLLRYKLLNFGNMFTTLSLSETMYIANK
jgi:ubiquinone/menaquinone biosynthesis C-methylase UbiE